MTYVPILVLPASSVTAVSRFLAVLHSTHPDTHLYPIWVRTSTAICRHFKEICTRAIFVSVSPSHDEACRQTVQYCRFAARLSTQTAMLWPLFAERYCRKKLPERSATGSREVDKKNGPSCSGSHLPYSTEARRWPCPL